MERERQPELIDLGAAEDDDEAIDELLPEDDTETEPPESAAEGEA